MERLRVQAGWLILMTVCAALSLSLASGCSLLATAMYIIEGTATKADFDGLKGKRVAVVCRPATLLHFRDDSVSRDLAKQVGNCVIDG